MHYVNPERAQTTTSLHSLSFEPPYQVWDWNDAQLQEDLTTKEEQPISATKTIEELKSKLGTNIELSPPEGNNLTMIPEGQRAPVAQNEDGLIIPKKPPNPVKENSERQSLHRELMFNQKIGKNVLNQKSELQKALEKQKENRAKKEIEGEMAKKAPEFQKVVADRQYRLGGNKGNENENDKVINPTFLEARKNLRTRTDSK